MEKSIIKVGRDICTGCGACYNSCKFGAIKMEYDSEGFQFPTVNHGECVDCGLCLEKCPAVNPVNLSEKAECYAVMGSDELRMKSSSGGMFSLLAEKVLSRNGYVCGAAYTEDYQRVEHIIVNDEEGLARLRGSKYVQSDTGTVYREIKALLDNGNEVLFSGCPCQVAGLKKYLGVVYEKLFTVDLVCHGANSLTAYRSFLSECAKGRTIESVNFREKEVFGWSTPTTIKYTDGTVTRNQWDKCPWYKGFLSGIINRLCCYSCQYAKDSRVGDITLADFWQVMRINADWDDRKGTSLVLINSPKGEKYFEDVRLNMKLCESAPIEIAKKYNGQLNNPQKRAPGRKFFFNHLPKDGYHKSLWYGQKYRYDVGLVGWWFASNYGSALTYYALGKILEDIDLLAIMIDIPKLDGSPWEDETKITIDFISKYFPISKHRKWDKVKECNAFCDMFMLGSDQLWTKLAIDLTGYIFFLDFVDDEKKKIAFATSFGHSEFTGTKNQREYAAALLENFDYISVREESGVEACRKYFGLEVKRDLDPVFLCDRENYDALANESVRKEESGFMLCYILDPDEEKQAAIQDCAKKTGLNVVAILDMKTGRENAEKWHTGKLVENVSVEDFVYYIKQCDFLITDSHHGACLGIIYNKNLFAIANSTRGITRFTHLFGLFNIMHKLVFSAEDIIGNDSLLDSIDYEAVNSILEREKRSSLERLSELFKTPNSNKPFPVKKHILSLKREIEILKKRSESDLR